MLTAVAGEVPLAVALDVESADQPPPLHRPLQIPVWTRAPRRDTSTGTPTLTATRRATTELSSPGRWDDAVAARP